MRIVIPGFPTEVSESIELPNIGEIIRHPHVGGMSAEDVVKYGTSLHQMLLDKAPLKNDKKHVTVSAWTQYLSPTMLSQPPFVKPNAWHIDSVYEGGPDDESFEDSERVHILLSETSAPTIYNKHEFEMDLDTLGLDYNKPKIIMDYINANEKELGIVGQPVEPNKFTTFLNHLHRGSTASGYEFRFTFRVQETNVPPRPMADAIRPSSFIHSVDPRFPAGSIKSIEITKGGILIHSPDLWKGNMK